MRLPIHSEEDLEEYVEQIKREFTEQFESGKRKPGWFE